MADFTDAVVDRADQQKALEALPEAVEAYENLLKKKFALKSQTEENDQAIKDQADMLCQLISDAGMQNYAYGGYTYTPGTIHKYYLLSEADCMEKGIFDRFAPFEEDEALCSLVKKDINWRSLQSSLRELEESEDGIPEDVMAVLNVSDEFGITRRAADTKNKNKVAEALKKRRNENV